MEEIFKSVERNDIAALAANMASSDRREVVEWTLLTPLQGLEMSVRGAEVAFAAYSPKGEILAIFGASRQNLMDDNAIIWALCSSSVAHNKLFFLKHTREGFERIAKAMPEVELFTNHVSLNHPGAVRWIEYIGGSLSITPPIKGVGGGAFKEFGIMNPYYQEEE